MMLRSVISSGGVPLGDAVAAEAGSLNGLIFRTDNLEKAFENVQAIGAEVIQEPKAQPWGVSDCAFRDPSGTMIRLTQASPAQ